MNEPTGIARKLRVVTPNEATPSYKETVELPAPKVRKKRPSAGLRDLMVAGLALTIILIIGSNYLMIIDLKGWIRGSVPKVIFEAQHKENDRQAANNQDQKVLVAELKELRDDLKALRLQVGPDSPEVKKREAQIAAKQAEVEAERAARAKEKKAHEKSEAEYKERLRLAKLETKAEREAREEAERRAKAEEDLRKQIETEARIAAEKLETEPPTDAVATVVAKDKDEIPDFTSEHSEALYIYYHLMVPESRGKFDIYGPMVPIKVKVPKLGKNGKVLKYKDGKPVMVKANWPGIDGKYPDWVTVGDGKKRCPQTKKLLKKGVPYHQAIGPVQMMMLYAVQWAKAATGKDYTPAQLMADPKLYRKVALFRVISLLRRFKNTHKGEKDRVKLIHRDVYSAWHSNLSYAEALKVGAKDANMETTVYANEAARAEPTTVMERAEKTEAEAAAKKM